MADTPDKATTRKAEKKAREGRSPAFPFIDLKKALERAEEFRAAEGKHSVPTLSANKAWKLGEDSVAARRTVAALGYFGLFEDEGTGEKRKVRLSDRALKILLDKQPLSPERDQLIKEAALTPIIHKELWDKWGDELPSDATFETYLVRDRGFSASGAADFMPAYKNTLAFAKLSKSDKMSEPSENNDGESDMTSQQQSDKAGQGFTPPPPPKPGMLQDVFTLEEGSVTVTFPSTLSAASYQDLEDHLKIFMRKAKRRVGGDEGAAN